MNLLIIEDELRLSDMLRDYFVGKGHAVTLCGDGWNGLDTALTGRYDVIVLDVMLPGMDGFEVLRRLRAADDDTPVLMLTARSSLQDKLSGFENGAEDYLTKPFDIEELKARLCVLTKKRAGAENAALRFGELLLQRDDHLRFQGKFKVWGICCLKLYTGPLVKTTKRKKIVNHGSSGHGIDFAAGGRAQPNQRQQNRAAVYCSHLCYAIH